MADPTQRESAEAIINAWMQTAPTQASIISLDQVFIERIVKDDGSISVYELSVITRIKTAMELMNMAFSDWRLTSARRKRREAREKERGGEDS